MQLQKEILFNTTFWRQDVPRAKIVASSCPASYREYHQLQHL